MFRSILIANRGEIAIRIMRTARRLGLQTVAVYSDADRDALHVGMADKAVRIGPAPARDSYLRADRLIEAARETGAEAIHPGYGFLSERPDLPRACAKSGIAWVGPNLRAIEAMGSKVSARLRAREAGVPVLPAYDGEHQEIERLAAEARRIGFPVMIKAVAGGGGKGMRPVLAEDGLPASIVQARREAEAAFGDGRLFVEKLVERSRHVEVQVLGDKHGNVVQLLERDCSVQRGNQKLIEEAPAPQLSDATRAALHGDAVRLATSIGYDSVGTMEFILDAATEQFFFLEMNTRLQVEHTVTEAITGLDLVEWQIRVAAGEKLGFGQGDIRASGHAIQVRLTAERADEGFRPDVGRIALWHIAQDDGIRVDSGVDTGSMVGLSYDSLLAKVIAHGPDRSRALTRLATALESSTVLGPATTRAFLVDAVRHPIFSGGHATTRFIADAFPGGWTRPLDHLPTMRRLAAVVWWLVERDQVPHGPLSPWLSLPAFRLSAPSGRPGRSILAVGFDGAVTRVTIEGTPGRFAVSDESGTSVVEPRLLDGALKVEIDGVRHAIPFAVDAATVFLRFGRIEASFAVGTAVEAEGAMRAAAPGSGSSIVAPMPGMLAEIRVSLGAAVEAGEVIAVLESMKLFMDLRSPAAGRIVRIAFSEGQTLAAGDLIVAIEPIGDSGN